VWLGAILTAALFEVGKFLIGLYIGKQGLGSIYGPAASIVVVLIWVYYSAQLVLMGAEFTNVYARRYGSQKNAASTDRRPAEDRRQETYAHAVGWRQNSRMARSQEANCERRMRGCLSWRRRIRSP
jgi:membrane protein